MTSETVLSEGVSVSVAAGVESLIRAVMDGDGAAFRRALLPLLALPEAAYLTVFTLAEVAAVGADQGMHGSAGVGEDVDARTSDLLARAAEGDSAGLARDVADLLGSPEIAGGVIAALAYHAAIRCGLGVLPLPE